jgi:hypothetical protein
MEKIDFLFLEYYLQKRYSKKVEEYFKIGKQSVSDWRIANKVPDKRLLEFQIEEGTIDPKKLFEKIYPN